MESRESHPRWRTSPTLDTSVLEELRAYSDEEQDLAEELVGLFLEDSPQQLLALQRALQNADLAEVEKRSHRLKGSAGSIGAVRLREICGALEEAARSGQAPVGGEEVFAEMQSLREALASIQKHST
ncbi:MAG: Hpt domain-containing protein [Bryobacterales bacterium]|nr:Hpt domain-containing protein [Bryobacterales bacterium]